MGSKPVLAREAIEAYAMSGEDQEDYCIGWQAPPCDPMDEVNSFTSSAWNYTSSDVGSSVPIKGTLQMYGGGGYVAVLDVNKDVTLAILDELLNNLWIDRHTRGIMVEFTVFNPDANLHTIATMLLEYAESGGIMHHTEIYTLRLYSYTGFQGMFVLAIHVIYMIIVVYFTVREGIKIYKQRGTYFENGWQLLDMCIIILSYIGAGVYAIRYGIVRNRMTLYHRDPTAYINMQQVAAWDSIYGGFLGIVTFLFTLRIIRVLSFSARIAAILDVLRVGRARILSFMFIFMVLFTVYACVGYLLFGAHVAAYRHVTSAMGDLLSTMLGKNRYQALKEADPTFSAIYFFFYCTSYAILMMNFLVAVITETINSVIMTIFFIYQHSE